MSSHQFVNDLISLANVPIAAPSANLSGHLSGTNLDDIFGEFSDSVDYIAVSYTHLTLSSPQTLPLASYLKSCASSPILIGKSLYECILFLYINI